VEPETIDIRNAREHNLASVSLSLPRNQLIVFTGVSGSGKSSLAFDTLYAEGQRRYIESLSSYARQFMGQMQKPDCDLISGLSPAIAIQQKTAGWNPRSTVGTITGIYDFLRVLYARVGTQHCTRCGRPIAAQSREQIVQAILQAFATGPDAYVLVLAPVARGQKGEFRDLFNDLLRAGYVRARVDGVVVSLRNDLSLQKNQRHDIEVVIDRLRIDPASRARLAEAVESALRTGDGTLLVVPAGPSGGGAADDSREEAAPRRPGRRRSASAAWPGERVFSSKYACARCALSYQPPTPQLFSFNSPAGMCMTCDGLGELYDFDPDLLVPDPSLNFWAPCIAPMRTKIGRWRRHIYEGVARAVGFDLNAPWKDLTAEARDAIFYGTGERLITYAWRWSGGVWKHGDTFAGVIAELRDKYRKAQASFIRAYYEQFMQRGVCPDCNGGRLNEQALAVRLPIRQGAAGPSQGPNIREFCVLSVTGAAEMLERLDLSPVQQVVVEEVLKELRLRLAFLLNVGLHYLAMDRTAPTLSGGELQRIRLAAQIGSGLVGVLYILDEPSIGLHARDNRRLLDSLRQLQQMGNTVIVVEHDEETMREADYLVDFGPGPGVRGGRIVSAGRFEEVAAAADSLTGQYLRGDRRIEIPDQRRPVGRCPRPRRRSV